MNEVLKAGLTAMGPVLHMVTLDEMPGGAAGEAATAIPSRECPVNGRGDATGLATDIQGHAGAVLRETYDARVAGLLFVGIPDRSIERGFSVTNRQGAQFKDARIREKITDNLVKAGLPE